MGQLIDNENLKPSENIKIELNYKETHKMYWLHIILRDKGNKKNFLIFDHHIVKCQLYSLNKLIFHSC